MIHYPPQVWHRSRVPDRPLHCAVLAFLTGFSTASPSLRGDDFTANLLPFFNKHCYECHDEQSSKGGLDLDALSQDLTEPPAMQKWVRIFDRVAAGEMPPKEKPSPDDGEKRIFRDHLAPSLTAAHESQKGTVLRRLNRREYENTLNDLLGVNLDVSSLLPEDGRSGEFDTIGEALGVSASQMRNYLDAASLAIETAIAKTTAPPEATKTTASYAETQGAEKFVGEAWGKALDEAIVFFRELGYPTGMLREANSKRAGLHRIRVTGYAYQSDKPVIFAVGGTTFQRAAGRPTYGYFAFAPGKPQTVELTAWMDRNYMVEITPKGIADPDYLIKRDGVQNYKGPGLAIHSVEIEGPLVERFPSKGHELIFSGLDQREIEPRNPADKQRSSYVPKFEIVFEDPVADLAPALKRFATAAFRRPVADEDILPYLALFEKEKNDGADFESALKTALVAVLCAPDFLYLREKSGALDDHALASRLSYFLSRSLPDEALIADAASGRLAKDSGTLLRGTGGAILGLPFLEAMLPAFSRAAAPSPPQRFVAMCATLGFHGPHLFPGEEGNDYDPSPYLAKLKDHRRDFTLFSGLSHPEQQGNNGHASEMTWLTAARRPGLAGFKNSISLDQLIASAIGSETRYPYLSLSTSGRSISWTANGVEIPGETSPEKLFKALFVQGTELEVAEEMKDFRRGRSILDTVLGEAKRLERDLGTRDREKLDEYLASVRELEGRLQESEGWVQKPKPQVDVEPPRDVQDRNDAIARQRLMNDMIVLALQTDSTRTVTFQLSGMNAVPVIPGVNNDWHNLSHHGKDPEKIDELKLIEEAEFGVFAEFLAKLKGIEENGRSLLDRTTVLYGSNLGNASSHDWRNLPILLAGGGFKHQGYVAHDEKDNTPLCNLFVPIAQRMGLEIDRFGTSTAAGIRGLEG